MNIQSNVSFKGVAPEVMQNFAKLNPGARMNLAKHYNFLNESKSIDLILDNQGKPAIKIKKVIENKATGSKNLEKDSLVKMGETTYVEEPNSSTVMIRDLTSGNRDYFDLKLNFVTKEDAKAIAKELSYEHVPGKKPSDKHPILAAAIELSERLKQIINQKDEIMSKFTQ